MKEQIEEMAKIICGFCAAYLGDCNGEQKPCEATRIESEALYNADYRKQKESVWSTGVMFDVSAQKITGYTHVCQSCFYLYKDKKPQGNKFCPNCGAKMKGGAE